MWRLVVVALAACGTQSPPAGAFTRIEVANVLAEPSHELDLLLVIDDSNGGSEHEHAFGLAVPALLGKLAAIPGGRPSLHIGVATSDMGTTGSLDYDHPAPSLGQLGSGGCAQHGKDGALQLGSVTASDRFLVDEPGHTNYQGTLADAISTLVNVGGGGCGFAQDFAAIERALVNPLNAGFRRAGANLGIVILADEDDCSALDPGLFAASAELGPLEPYRCTRFGVACDQDITTVGHKSNCGVRDDSPYIASLAPIRSALAAAAPDPAQLSLFAIVGDRFPFEIELHAPPGGGDPVTALASSCHYQDGSSVAAANPGVRIGELADRLGSHGGVASICSADLSAPLAQLGRQLARMHGLLCLEGTLADISAEPGLQPSCTASDVAPSGDEIELPACPAEGDCLEIATDAAACDTPDHLRAVIHRAVPPPAGTHVVVRCQSS